MWSLVTYLFSWLLTTFSSILDSSGKRLIGQRSWLSSWCFWNGSGLSTCPSPQLPGIYSVSGHTFIMSIIKVSTNGLQYFNICNKMLSQPYALDLMLESSWIISFMAAYVKEKRFPCKESIILFNKIIAIFVNETRWKVIIIFLTSIMCSCILGLFWLFTFRPDNVLHIFVPLVALAMLLI